MSGVFPEKGTQPGASTPRNVALIARIPCRLRTGLLWLFARSKMVKDLGEFGPVETRWLIDAMVVAAPTRARQLAALRPRCATTPAGCRQSPG